MLCQICSAENPQNAKFCIQCATALLRLCKRCGCESPFGARVCPQCATPLDETALIQTKPGSTDVARTGERRHLTVLFCDLVGSTAISAQLDPEEWREPIASYHGAASQPITGSKAQAAKS